ncbi:DUF2637 domain-containing protein [Sphaerisporangium sp. B11E5]|uniref:DUF2637 domain-containing protein n=1 Tax=Sphaerisporangium sp. B11E5 TaxID=3153563 RepID=UPI00325E1DAB
MQSDFRLVRCIRRTTIVGVSLLALIAAVVSFRHMRELCLQHGEDQLAAVLIPLAVDGTIVVASMSILQANRYGARGGVLAWALLITGSLASLGANVAVAEPSVIGRVIAAWPSASLIGSYELLMAQIRRVAEHIIVQQDCANVSAGDDDLEAGVHPRDVVDLRRAAWGWAQANRGPDGALPSGRAIAEQFERSPRWGRWIKKVGLTGELG